MAAADEHRFGALERAVSEIRDAVGQIAAAMVQIARLEERHQETKEGLGRAFAAIEHCEREQDIQRTAIVQLQGEIAPLKESRNWLVAAMIGIVGIVALAVAKKIGLD